MIASRTKDDTGSSIIKYKQYGDDRWKTDDSPPYFYVSAQEGYTLPPGIAGNVERNVDVNASDGTELHRVVLLDAQDMRDARDAAEDHYEADIPHERRFYIDNVEGSMATDGDITESRPHIMHCDIEIWADGGGVSALDAKQPIISVACYSEKYNSRLNLLLEPDGWSPESETEDDKGRRCTTPEWCDDDETVYLFSDETEMIKALGRVIVRSGVEVLTGWNFEEFDAAYLIKRCEKLRGVDSSVLSPLGECYVSSWTTDEGNLNIKSVIKGIDVFDMFEGYRHLKRNDKPPNWKLETVAEHEGTEVGKMEFDTSRVGPIWEKDPLWVMEYNRRDAVLTHHVSESVGAFDLFLELHRAFAIPLPDTIKNSVLVEMYVMSRAPAWGITDRILDSKRTETNDFEGGNTKEPNEGLYEWVFSADVTSEYPNWVRAANLSPETIVTPEDAEWDRDDLIETPRMEEPPDDDPDAMCVDGDYLPVKFLPHDERLGILPRAVGEMFQMKEAKTELRSGYEYGTDEYKQADLQRDATKWFLNSIQGVTGMETHRLSKNEVSASITSFGRVTVEKMIEVGEELGRSFVYGDTDSAFFVDENGDEVFDKETAVEAVEELAARTNEVLPQWAKEKFNIVDDRRANLRVEPEKVAKRAFFPNKKKRYTLWMVWADGEDVDVITHTGWSIVRSDTSVVEERVQRKTLEALMHEKGEDYITGKLCEEMQKVVNGEYSPMDMARPQGSSKAFSQYGVSSDSLGFDGVPYFVAAMMSSNALLGTDYQGGDKTWMLPVRDTKYVGAINGRVMEVDQWGKSVDEDGDKIAESTNNVNYLAIDEDTELPDWVEINYGKVIDNITGKVDRIYDSLGWDKSELSTGKSSAMEIVEVERIQNKNQTLGAFSS